MAGQGSTTIAYAASLRKEGWRVVYTCIPNTPHVGVVAISIGASCKQHYPDILAFKGEITKIVEVEVQLTAGVAHKIRERFKEIGKAFQELNGWNNFRQHVQETTGIQLPELFVPVYELLICTNGRKSSEALVNQLSSENVRVVTGTNLVDPQKHTGST